MGRTIVVVELVLGLVVIVVLVVGPLLLLLVVRVVVVVLPVVGLVVFVILAMRLLMSSIVVGCTSRKSGDLAKISACCDYISLFVKFSRERMAAVTSTTNNGPPADCEAHPVMSFTSTPVLKHVTKMTDKFTSRSLTALPIIDTQDGDMSTYIPSTKVSALFRIDA